jgi:hypothetical protein
MGYITRSVEVCSYTDVDISIKEIIREIEEKDAKELMIGLIKKFPMLLSKEIIPEEKLFPESIKYQLISKY